MFSDRILMFTDWILLGAQINIQCGDSSALRHHTTGHRVHDTYDDGSVKVPNRGGLFMVSTVLLCPLF